MIKSSALSLSIKSPLHWQCTTDMCGLGGVQRLQLQMCKEEEHYSGLLVGDVNDEVVGVCVSLRRYLTSIKSFVIF